MQVDYDVGRSTGEKKHPHGPLRGVPVRVEPETLRELSRIRPVAALSAVVSEWFAIGTTIATCELVSHPIAYAAGVLVIGSRQHALAVITHDAAHWRFLPTKRINDWVADLFVAWPVFLTVELFRGVHGSHHRYLGSRFDGNRLAWHTHDAAGKPTREWTYPKPLGAFALKMVFRAAMFTGLGWVFRGLRAPITLRWPIWKITLFGSYFVGIVAAVSALGSWHHLILYWLLPYCTWQVAAQYLRLACEHSGDIGHTPAFDSTRSTVPGLFARLLVLPRNIGYHIEHHWYPSVPSYNLPDLQRVLSDDPTFARYANIQRSLLASLRQCVKSPNRGRAESIALPTTPRRSIGASPVCK